MDPAIVPSGSNRPNSESPGMARARDLTGTVAKIYHMRPDEAFEIIGAHVDVTAPLGAGCQAFEGCNQIVVVAVCLGK